MYPKKMRRLDRTGNLSRGLGGLHHIEKDLRTCLPGHAQSEVTARLARQFQRVDAGGAQISIKSSDWSLADDVARCCGWESRHRQAARQRLKQHQAEGIGAAGEHEDVGSSIDAGEILALPLAEEHRLWVATHQH